MLTNQKYDLRTIRIVVASKLADVLKVTIVVLADEQKFRELDSAIIYSTFKYFDNIEAFHSQEALQEVLKCACDNSTISTVRL